MDFDVLLAVECILGKTFLKGQVSEFFCEVHMILQLPFMLQSELICTRVVLTESLHRFLPSHVYAVRKPNEAKMEHKSTLKTQPILLGTAKIVINMTRSYKLNFETRLKDNAYGED